jgi:hypothetical protein
LPVSFFLLAVYIRVEALRTLVNADHPAGSRRFARRTTVASAATP